MRAIVLDKLLKDWVSVKETVASEKRILTRIVGGYFRKQLLLNQANLKKGTKLRLVSDPANEHDMFAIKIFAPNWDELWYIKKELARCIMRIQDWECSIHKEIEEGDLLGNSKIFGVPILLTNIG